MTQRPRFPVQLDRPSAKAPARKPGLPAATPAPQRAAPSPISLPNAPRAMPVNGAVPKARRAVDQAPSHADGQALVAPRQAMVARLKASGISDTAVLQALAAVERHRFVDSGLGAQAYEDTSLPIGLGQTISKPSVVARMLELLRQGRPGKLGRVLEIGTGCGYQAAVLSHLATEVYSIERLRGLHERARDLLRPFRLPNVHLLFGDGMAGFPKGAPYAGIIAAAGGEALPEAWLAQLAVGGRLVAPLVTPTGKQALVVVDRTSQGLQQTLLEAVHFVPLKSGLG